MPSAYQVEDILLCSSWRLYPIFHLLHGHLDGNRRVIEPCGIVVHGAIDGLSHLMVLLCASTNNRIETVLQIFIIAVPLYNFKHVLGQTWRCKV